MQPIHWIKPGKRVAITMDLPDTATSEDLGKIDFDIHGVVGVRLVNPSPGDIDAACKLLGQPCQLPLTTPDITVRFVKDLPARGIRLLGRDEGFTDDEFFLLQKGTRRVQALIPFDHIGGPCEIVCRSSCGSLPLLMPIINLTSLRKECIPMHASAVVHNGVGLLMAGWAHCGKTAALLGFASYGADFVGEEWVLLSGNGQGMYGLVRPLEITHWHVASLPHVRRVVSLLNRSVFQAISVPRRLRKMIRGERIGSSFVFRSLQRASAALGDRLRPAIAPSAIFGDRIRSSGAPADKVFLFVNHEEEKIDVRQFSPREMASRLTVLVQHELIPLLVPYVAYRFAFPRRRNEFLERAGEYSLAILTRALQGKETYMVRLPYEHPFPQLFNAIQPLF